MRWSTSYAAGLSLLGFLLPLISYTSSAPTQLTDGSLPELIQLTAANWSTLITQGSWLIEFYSPYCKPCKTFLPLWVELVKNKAVLASDDPSAPFRLAQVNCHAQGDLCVQEEVPHFPRLSLYKDGKRAQGEYQGNREYTELAAWIDEEVQEYRQTKAREGGGGGSHSSPNPGVAKQDVLQGPQMPPKPSVQPDVSQPEPIIARPTQDNGSPLATSTTSTAVMPQPSPQSQQDKATDEQAAVVPAPQPQPQAPPPPPPVDLSRPNPFGNLLKFGSSPNLLTVQDLRDWLGVTVEDTQLFTPEQKPGRGAARLQAATANPGKAENTNEGHLGTGDTDPAKGHGGAHLTSSSSATSAPSATLPADRKLTPARGGTFVKFFAPWCPHCKAMAQAFEKLAPALREKLNVLEVDCQAYPDVCRAFHVKSYPTLRLYSPVNQLISEYRGSRTFDAMLRWCEKAAEEEVVDLVDVKDLRAWNDDVTRREDVRFLWVAEIEGSEDIKAAPAALEEERRLVTLASRSLFTSPYRVYRSTSPEVVQKFQSRMSSWKGSKTAGGRYRSVLLAFKDHDSSIPTSTYHVPASFDPAAQRLHLSQWLDWTRYPTLSQVGGDAWVDVMNNVHAAPVALGLLSVDHHDGDTFALGSGEVRRRGELAALKRMALAWRDGAYVFNKTESTSPTDSLAKYSSNGGLLWGWIDADRHRSALKKYYKLDIPLEKALPALLLVDTASMSYWQLPTLKRSKLVDNSALDPPVVDASHPAGGWRGKMSYTGVSSEVSTWLGEGALSKAHENGAAPPASQLLSSFVDDLSLLPFIVSISRGEQRRGRRSTRSYLDRGTEALVDFASQHWVLSFLVLFGLVAGLILYVRDVQEDGRRRGIRGGYRSLVGRKKD